MKTGWKNNVIGLMCLAFTGLASCATGHDSISAPPPPPADVLESAKAETVPFYSVLEPHGNWMKVEPFGMVWRPRVSVFNSSWKPYCDNGKWVWQDNAWCWQSQYEWGWAPFHYGRWMRGTTIGWVWVPGTDWSPGWVTWQQTSSAYRWAPLPVERRSYASVSWNTGHGIQWSFTVTDSHYSSAHAREFGIAAPTQTVVVRPVEPVVTVVYRSEPVYYPVRHYSHSRYRSHHHEDRKHEYRTSTTTRTYERPSTTRSTSSAQQRTRTESSSSKPSRTSDRRTTGISNIMSRK